MKLIHSSDWQIGKVFRFVDNATMGLLQEARLAAIARLGELAVAHGADHVLVAGDVYDMEALSPRSLHQPLERMRMFEGITWHLLPGNHDPHRPNGLWDRLLRAGVPGNVVLHLAPEPWVREAAGLAVLPAPLHYRRTLQDPTAWMDGAATPEGLVRVGVAHGTVTGFGADDQEVANYVSPDRPRAAGLAYLALGDWHGQKRIGDRAWYSGTPETDAFDVDGGGQALLVEIPGPRAVPGVTPLATGHYRWVTLREQVGARADVDAVASRLRALGDDLSRILVRLEVEGAVSLQDRQHFEERILEQVSAAFCHLRVDDSRLFPRPTEEDLDRIDQGGFVRAAAETLRRRAEDAGDPEHELAALALQRLYVEHRKLQGRGP